MRNFSTNPRQTQIPVSGGAADLQPVYTPVCEICGAEHPQCVTLLDRSPLCLCTECRRLFGFEEPKVGEEEGAD